MGGDGVCSYPAWSHPPGQIQARTSPQSPPIYTGAFPTGPTEPAWSPSQGSKGPPERETEMGKEMPATCYRAQSSKSGCSM